MNLRQSLDQGIGLIAAGALALGLGAGTTLAQPYGMGRPHNNPAAFPSPVGARSVASHPYAMLPQEVAMRPGHYQPYCPPGQQPGMLPQQSADMMRTPGATPSRDPSTATPDQRQPSTTDPSTQTQTDMSQQQSMDNQFSDAQTSSSRASLSPGADTPQLGRNDQSNRLNLFDNMTAAPQTRVFYGYQYANRFDTALQPTTGLQSFLSANRSISLNTVLELNQGITSDFFIANQAIHRVGGEYAVNDTFSVAVQGQYIATGAEEDPSDTWTNPQIMFKQVVYRDCDTIFTGTLGITPETDNDIGDINEDTTKLYPGLLFYETLTRDLFIQGGAQVGIPLESNQVATSDWSFALGYWLYRDCDPCGHGRCHRPFFLRQLNIRGIIPQVNILGKHVVGDNTIVGPFGFASSASQVITGFTTGTFLLCDPLTGAIVGGPVTVTTPSTVSFSLPEGFVIYKEPRGIVDLTVGTTLLVGDGVQIGLGYSIPLTSDSVRDNELIMTYNFAF